MMTSTKDRPKTPNGWMAGYEARLSEGKGLTAREWDHVDELRRTLANPGASADRRMQRGSDNES
jgi:hypothetical protein